MKPDPNYFTCTLGQAAALREAAAAAATATAPTSPAKRSTIPQLLAHKAQLCPDNYAVGFIKPTPTSSYSSSSASSSVSSHPESSFSSTSVDKWTTTTKVFTFREIHEGVRIVASRLQELLLPFSQPALQPAVQPARNGKTGADPRTTGGVVEEGRTTVALICPSSAGFLFTWLGLIELGFSVLLVAPQCRPGAVAHLCKSCGVDVLLYDGVYAGLAAEAAVFAARRGSSGIAEEKEEEGKDKNRDGNIKGTIRAVPIPFSTDESVFEFIAEGKKKETGQVRDRTTSEDLEVGENSVAYIHHTSGTSSGLPKPIPQTHRAAVGVLPCLPSSGKATFTTTPLYHGGIADLFRAWTSDALIWLFPGRDTSITASTIVSCLRAIDGCTVAGVVEGGQASLRVAYFSSVPYVLQLLESDEVGLGYLQRMELVGVGGAALPVEIGDRLVGKGVHLLTRFGSAECGFLLSSHRDYQSDREWQYHRLSSEVKKFLKFEGHENDDGTHELIVLPGWPHMAKRNRDDGSFATGDLFEAHSTIENAWKYHSRADSQLTLLTGKKFDPAPLEDAISASSRLINDALIFGNGRPYPGVLLFRSTASRDLADTEFLDECRPAVEKLNAESQNHARIRDDMLIPMPCPSDGGQALEKSSKGTVLRGNAERKYKDAIEGAYSNKEEVAANVGDDDVLNFISDVVRRVLKSEDVGAEDELFHTGLDSMASIQIRQLLTKLLPKESRNLPLTVVEDCGTIRRLCDFVLDLRHRTKRSSSQNDVQLMNDMVAKYSDFNIVRDQRQLNQESGLGYNGECIVLTGATGALGSHMLQKLRQKKWVRKVYCLVRGASPSAAEERVCKALEQKGFPPLSCVDEDKHIVVLRSTLSHPTLGLDEEIYRELTRDATAFVHLAWAVNFRMRLQSFEKDHIGGLHNLISTALQSTRQQPPSFIFCSSVASVMNSRFADGAPESIIDDASAASPIGYSKSKWVAEQICHNANRNYSGLRDRIAVLRVGQLSGDSKRGIWNTQEAWPMMLSSVKATKALPALEKEPLSWLPVDIAADAFLDALHLLANFDLGRTEEKGPNRMHVYHVINNHRKPEWTDLLGWLKKMGEDFEVVDVHEWLRRLEDMERKGINHPSLKLLGHWKAAYGGNVNEGEATAGEGTGRGGTEGAADIRFQMEATKLAFPSLRNVGEVDEAYFRKLWDHIKNGS